MFLPIVMVAADWDINDNKITVYFVSNLPDECRVVHLPVQLPPFRGDLHHMHHMQLSGHYE